MTTRTKIVPGDGDPRHGTLNGYRNLGCHGPDCTKANAEAQYKYMHSHPEQMERNKLRTRELRAKTKAEKSQPNGSDS